MKNRKERFIILPFTIGCNSPSSVAVEAGGGKGGCSTATAAPTTSQSKKLRSESSRPTHVARRQKGGNNGSSGEQRTKSSSHGFLAIPKANITNGVDKLIKSLKSFSQLFDMILYKEEIEEVEVEMEIGFPTDVKHVTHIGLDGTTTTNPVKGWENLTPPEIITFPSISLRQFELAMAAQAEVGNNGNNNNHHHHLNPSRFS